MPLSFENVYDLREDASPGGRGKRRCGMRVTREAAPVRLERKANLRYGLYREILVYLPVVLFVFRVRVEVELVFNVSKLGDEKLQVGREIVGLDGAIDVGPFA